MAALNIYEVIFFEGNYDPDTIYIVVAHSHLEAVELAERNRRIKLDYGEAGLRANADLVCLIGESRIRFRSTEPQIIRGPFREPGYTRGDSWLFNQNTKEWVVHEFPSWWEKLENPRKKRSKMDRKVKAKWDSLIQLRPDIRTMVGEMKLIGGLTGQNNDGEIIFEFFTIRGTFTYNETTEEFTSH